MLAYFIFPTITVPKRLKASYIVCYKVNFNGDQTPKVSVGDIR